MPDKEAQTSIGSKGIYEHGIDLHDLKKHVEKSAPSVQGTVDLLGNLSRLEDVKRFHSIGKEAGEWHSHLLETYTNMKGPLGLLSITLKDKDHNELKETVQKWVIEFERGLEGVIPVTPSLTLSLQKVLRGPPEFVSPEFGEEFQDELRDLNEACINLVVGANTSAELMSLRAVESLLRKWYVSETDREMNTNWNGALDAIDSASEGSGPKEIQLMNYLRERRNEVAHPDRHSSLQDAETTLMQAFNLTENLIIKMRQGED